MANAVVNKILDLLGVDNGETDENEEMLDNEYSYSYEPVLPTPLRLRSLSRCG